MLVSGTSEVGIRNSSRSATCVLKRSCSNFGKLARAGHRLARDHERRDHLGVAVLARVQIQHELDQRALQRRARSEIKREARAGDLAGALEVEDAQPFTDRDVILRREIDDTRRAPAPDFDIGLRVRCRPER